MMTSNNHLPRPITLSWGALVSRDFAQRVIAMSDGYDWADASWLMACMAFESAETFSPSVRNAAGSGATGLIQIMPSTARGLGTTTEALAAMSAVQQLDWVEKYFAPYAHRIASLSDMYMAILMPRYIGDPDYSVLFSDGVAYRENSGLDANSDGQVTKREAAVKVQAKYTKGMQHGYSAVVA